MAYGRRTVRVSSLALDLDNPRLGDGIESQDDAIAAMFKDPKKTKEMTALAKSIVLLGGLDPSTLPVVTEEDATTVVLEGNRRVTCLKLLHNPSLATTKETRTAFQRIAASATSPLPRSISVIVYDSRQEYDDFLEMRHTGENDGAGLKPWSSLESTRFKERRSNRAYIHTALLRWAEQHYQSDDTMLELVNQVRDKKLTTLRRFLVKDVRLRLGLVHRQDSLSVEFTADQLRPFLHQMLYDLVNGRTPDNRPWSRARKDDVIAYVDRHNHLLPHQDDKDPTQASTAPAPRPLVQRTRPTQARETSETPVKDYGPPPPDEASALDSPGNYVFPDVDFGVFGPRIEKIGSQAKVLPVTRYPDLCGVMLRVLIDLTTTHFLQRHKREVPQWFHEKVIESIKFLDPNIESQRRRKREDLVTVFTEFNKKGDDRGFAAERLHDMVHSTTRITTPSEIRAESARHQVLVRAMEDNLRQAPRAVATSNQNGQA
jgi:hypothetical protein